uniref:Vesicle transport protein USE1 n=1 Tax=Saccoglossus kowalevskii TaxID=10224 RepID=A0ABM0MNJ9_SACKO|nr:PREDICTED: vesicle transport protein USE1-like [Saccoglossus kowalevskii]
MASRLETNLQRLLSRCEVMAAERRHSDWRLEKFKQLLDNIAAKCLITKTSMNIRRTRKKKRTFTSAQCTIMKIELERLASKPTPEIMQEYTKKIEFLRGLIATEKLTCASDKAMASQLLTPGKTITLPDTSSASSVTTKELHLQAASRYTNEMRDELLGRLGDTTRLADINYDKLDVESKRLEAHTKKACNWWVWIMMAIVCLTFVWMIMFIRMFPKRS